MRSVWLCNASLTFFRPRNVHQSLVTQALPEPPAALPSSQQLHQYMSHEQLSRNLAMSGKANNFRCLLPVGGVVPDFSEVLCTQTVRR